jgi:hypothetical protein
VAPQLEKLILYRYTPLNEENVIPNIFGVENCPENTVKWPKLRHLALTTEDGAFPQSVFEQLVFAAPHCPKLEYLSMEVHYNLAEKPRLKRIPAVLRKACAWPSMKDFNCGLVSNFASLQVLWPKALLRY